MKNIIVCLILWLMAFNPNLSGQEYVISPLPYNPQPFTGSSLVDQWVAGNNDDGVSGAVSIGFDFCFYGFPYHEVYISTNGWISFSSGQSLVYSPRPIPSLFVQVPRNCIMAPWQDWWSNYNGNGNVRYQLVGTSPFRKFIVSYVAVPMFACVGKLGTFQIVLNECNSSIEIHLLNKPHCKWTGGMAVLGLHDATGTIAHTVSGRNSTIWAVDSTSPEGWYFAPSLLCEGSTFRCVSNAPVEPNDLVPVR